MMDYPCDPRAGAAPGVLVVQAGGHGRPGGDRASTGCAESTDQPHLVEGLDAVTRRLGGLSRRCGTTGEAPGASAGSDPRPASQPAS
jgi:hypothetical protein